MKLQQFYLINYLFLYLWSFMAFILLINATFLACYGIFGPPKLLSKPKITQISDNKMTKKVIQGFPELHLSLLRHHS